MFSLCSFCFSKDLIERLYNHIHIKWLYSERDALANEMESVSNSESDRNEIKRVLSMAVIDDMSTVELRQLVRSLIDRIIINGPDDIEIHWAF